MSIFSQYCQGPLTQACTGGGGSFQTAMPPRTPPQDLWPTLTCVATYCPCPSHHALCRHGAQEQAARGLTAPVCTQYGTCTCPGEAQGPAVGAQAQQPATTNMGCSCICCGTQQVGQAVQGQAVGGPHPLTALACTGPPNCGRMAAASPAGQGPAVGGRAYSFWCTAGTHGTGGCCQAGAQATGTVTNFPTCGGPTHCSGIYTCCHGGAQEQAVGGATTATVCTMAPPTCGGPTHCSGIYTCCHGGVQAAQGQMNAEPPTAFPTCTACTHCPQDCHGGVQAAQGQMNAEPPTAFPTCTACTYCPQDCHGGAQGRAAGGDSVYHTCVTCDATCWMTCHEGARGQATVTPGTQYITCPTVCHGIWTCAADCQPPTHGYPITMCQGVHTCGPPTVCLGVTCACGG